MAYAIVAGHNDIIPGASGNGYQEHVVARQIKDRIIHYLRQLGETAYDCTDEIGHTKDQVWLNAAKNCNRVAGKDDIIIALHLNAGGGTGTEVFDFKGTLKAKCQSVAQRLSKDFKWNDRGWKDGSWIGLIKETTAPVIYIELCFIDNVTDITKLTRDLDTAAVGIVEEVTGKKIDSVSAAGSVENEEEDLMNVAMVELIGEKKMDELHAIYQAARLEGILHSTDWEVKALNRSLNVGEAIYLNAVLHDPRRYKKQ